MNRTGGGEGGGRGLWIIYLSRQKTLGSWCIFRGFLRILGEVYEFRSVGTSWKTILGVFRGGGIESLDKPQPPSPQPFFSRENFTLTLAATILSGIN